MRLIYIGFAIFTISGCSNNDLIVQKRPDIEIRHFTNIHDPVKDGTLAFSYSKRLGAAYGMAGYNHVLAIRSSEGLSDYALQAETVETAINLFSLTEPDNLEIDSAKIIKKVGVKSYSLYEMSRWERFCGHGSMDERDWVFIAEQGRNNLPAELKKTCTEPAYTRQDYLSAWSEICNNEDTGSYYIIRNQTIAPKDSCKL